MGSERINALKSRFIMYLGNYRNPKSPTDFADETTNQGGEVFHFVLFVVACSLSISVSSVDCPIFQSMRVVPVFSPAYIRHQLHLERINLLHFLFDQ